MKPPDDNPRGEFLGAPQGSTGTLEGDIARAVDWANAPRPAPERPKKTRKRKHKLSRKERRKRSRQRARS